MPKLTNAVPKYRKHTSGNARVTINGRDYLLGPWKSRVSIREYDRLIAEYLSTGRSPTFGIEQEGYTVAMLARDYLRHCRTEYGKTAEGEVMRVRPVLRALVDLYKDTDASEFTPDRLKAVRHSMLESGLTRQGINDRIKTLKRVFKWGASEGKFPASVYDTLRLMPSLRRGRTAAPEAKPITPVADEIVEATLPHLSPIVADMVRIQRLIGCRPAEVCNLTPASFDKTGAVWVATLIEHKTEHHDHSRKLYVGPKAQTILATYLERPTDAPLFSPVEAVAWHRQQRHQRRTTPLSCGNCPGKSSSGLKGRNAKRAARDQFETASYRRAIHKGCDKAFLPPEPLCQKEGESDAKRRKRLTAGQLEELKAWQSSHRWSPNRLRHTRGTEIRREFGLEAAQVSLGHTKADVTQIYAERDEELAIEVASKTG